MQMRNVFCGVKRQREDLLHILPEIQCAGLPRLKKTQSCKDKPCHTQWITSPWKEVTSYIITFKGVLQSVRKHLGLHFKILIVSCIMELVANITYFPA